MGKRAVALGALFDEFAWEGPKAPRPGVGSITAAGLMDEVAQTYERLGGQRETPRLRPGPWDLTFDGWVLELDEENHFNRYRAITLNAPSYADMDAYDLAAYRAYCQEHEAKCSTHGRYWTNSSSEREFGEPSPRGDLSGNGSPRWRQRAFYDYIKDLAPKTDGLVISRISIWDTLTADGQTDTVGRVLQRAISQDLRGSAWQGALIQLVESRKAAPS